MTFIISIFEFKYKSEHKQVKRNKIKQNMCKADNFFLFSKQHTIQIIFENNFLTSLISKMNDNSSERKNILLQKLKKIVQIYQKKFKTMS